MECHRAYALTESVAVAHTIFQHIVARFGENLPQTVLGGIRFGAFPVHYPYRIDGFAVKCERSLIGGLVHINSNLGVRRYRKPVLVHALEIVR